MASLQPNCTLWKKKDETKLKNVCTVELPAGKTLELRLGDPSTTGNTTLIRYNVVSDSKQETIHVETKTEEFPWDSRYHVVNTHVISGPLTYSTSEDTDNAIQY